MTAEVLHDSLRWRYELFVDGQLAGVASYTVTDDDAWDFNSTVVMEEFSGRGLGKVLIGGAMADVLQRSQPIIATCEFVRHWLPDHPELNDLVKA